MRTLLAALLFSGCTPVSGEAPTDAQQVRGDAPVHVADAPGVKTAAVNCVDYAYTTTAADHSRSVSTSRYATIPEVAIGQDFVVTACGLTYIPPSTCPVGATCSGSFAPPGAACNVARNTGSFYAGKLTVLCGQTTTSYNAAGTTTGTSGFTYATITVTY